MRKVTGLESVAGVGALVEVDAPPQHPLERVLGQQAEAAEAAEAAAEAAAGVDGKAGQRPVPAQRFARVLVLDAVQVGAEVVCWPLTLPALPAHTPACLPACLSGQAPRQLRACVAYLLPLFARSLLLCLVDASMPPP